MVNGQPVSIDSGSSQGSSQDQRGDMALASRQRVLSLLNGLQIPHEIVNPPGVEGAERIGIRAQNDDMLRAVIRMLRSQGHTLVGVEPQFTNWQLTFASHDKGAVALETLTILPCLNGNKGESISPTERQDAVQDPRRNGRTSGSSSGLFLIILGPDGVGKSTLARQISDSLTPLFKQSGIFHWRPGVIRHSTSDKPLGQPHSLPARGVVSSLLYLLMFYLDYWLGYLGVERKILAAPGLIIFDRYLHDVMVDPFRYRYGGPSWVCRLLCSVVPPKDMLTLVLDAHEDIVFSRKKDLSLDQLRDQRLRYVNFAQSSKDTVLIDSSHGIEQTAAAAFRAILDYLERRVEPELNQMLPTRRAVPGSA
jgi:thymidylate kinase